MPIHYSIDPERRLVLATVRGDFTLDEIVASIDNAVQDSAFEPGFNVLSDHREVGNPITPTQLMQTVEHIGRDQSPLAGARWAVVTTKPASWGMMRAFAVWAESIPLTIQVFRSMEEAEAWLESDTVPEERAEGDPPGDHSREGGGGRAP